MSVSVVSTAVLRRVALAFGVTLTLGLVAAGPAQADPYRLTPGDALSLSHAGIDPPAPLRIDIDGDLRIPSLGPVAVQGLTLTEAEARIAGRMTSLGLYTDPHVTLAVTDYAPVIVSGAVLTPGRVDYMPGMTVAGALALAGGQDGARLSRTDLARVRTEAEAGQAIAALDIAAALARIARLEAQLDGPDTALVRPAAARDVLPGATAPDLDALLRAESEVLRNHRDRAAKLLGFWQAELTAIAAQRDTFDQRITVQESVLRSTAAALDTARRLSDRGLQTNARLDAAEQREADARTRLLELEAAKITAARAISDAERARAQFLANQLDTALTDLAEARLALQAATVRHRRYSGLTAVLDGQGGIGASGAAVRVDLISPRPDRPQGAVTLTTPVLPGETLIVTAIPSLAEADG